MGSQRDFIFHQASQENVLFLLSNFFYFQGNRNFLLSENNIQFPINDQVD